MYKKSAVLTFYAETPIHMGSGQSVSYVDLPIQRERHTSFPVLWSSGIKGVIRDLASRVWNDKDKVETIFGPEDGGSDFASCISITDAKILLYPVRSVKGVFAWITCPFVLKRFKEDLNALGINFKYNDQDIKILDVPDDKVFIASDNLKIQGQNSVALEEFVFEAEVKNEVKELAGFLKNFVHQNDLTKNLENHLAIVSDNVFKDFVNYAVEIRTRIRIDQALGTVDKKRGGLFSEELIPSESVFYSILFIKDSFKPNSNMNAGNVFSEINSLLSQNSLLQLGGDETTGKGYVRVKVFNMEGNHEKNN
jgi:CRISPR-associated protein Cmr4